METQRYIAAVMDEAGKGPTVYGTGVDVESAFADAQEWGSFAAEDELTFVEIDQEEMDRIRAGQVSALRLAAFA